MLAARNVWGKHPRELLGDPWDPQMLTDAMALEDWLRNNTLVLQ